MEFLKNCVCIRRIPDEFKSLKINDFDGKLRKYIRKFTNENIPVFINIGGNILSNTDIEEKKSVGELLYITDNHIIFNKNDYFEEDVVNSDNLFASFGFFKYSKDEIFIKYIELLTFEDLCKRKNDYCNKINNKNNK